MCLIHIEIFILLHYINNHKHLLWFEPRGKKAVCTTLPDCKKHTAAVWETSVSQHNEPDLRPSLNYTIRYCCDGSRGFRGWPQLGTHDCREASVSRCASDRCCFSSLPILAYPRTDKKCWSWIFIYSSILYTNVFQPKKNLHDNVYLLYIYNTFVCANKATEQKYQKYICINVVCIYIYTYINFKLLSIVFMMRNKAIITPPVGGE